MKDRLEQRKEEREVQRCDICGKPVIAVDNSTAHTTMSGCKYIQKRNIIFYCEQHENNN